MGRQQPRGKTVDLIVPQARNHYAFATQQSTTAEMCYIDIARLRVLHAHLARRQIVMVNPAWTNADNSLPPAVQEMVLRLQETGATVWRHGANTLRGEPTNTASTHRTFHDGNTFTVELQHAVTSAGTDPSDIQWNMEFGTAGTCTMRYDGGCEQWLYEFFDSTVSHIAYAVDTPLGS